MRMTKQKSLAENKTEVIKYLTWFQNYPKSISPYYITIYNFDDFKKTFSLMLYDNKRDVAIGDGLINDGLWRMVKQLPSCITAHRIYDLVVSMEEVDPTLEHSVRGLKVALFKFEYEFAESKYLKFKVDYPDLQAKLVEADNLYEEEVENLNSMRGYTKESKEEKKPHLGLVKEDED